MQVLGALGIECLSRGAKSCVFCDKSYDDLKILKQNLEKTDFLDKSKIYNKDYKKTLKILENNKFDIIFIDPPYKMDLAVDSIKIINELNLLNENGIIVLETDEPNRDLKELNEQNIIPFINRKYGRVTLLFIKSN